MKKKLLLASLLSIAAIFLVNALGARPAIDSPKEISGASVDYFLKVDGVEGESVDEGHKDEIDIDSFSWGGTTSEIGLLVPAVQKVRDAAGKVEIADFHFVAPMSKASPKLMEAAVKGQHIKEVMLFGIRAGEDRQEFMVVKLTDVLVTSYQTGGSSSGLPTDSFSMNFGKVEFEYKPQKPDGTLGEPVRGSWDVKKGESF